MYPNHICVHVCVLCVRLYVWCVSVLYVCMCVVCVNVCDMCFSVVCGMCVGGLYVCECVCVSGLDPYFCGLNQVESSLAFTLPSKSSEAGISGSHS